MGKTAPTPQWPPTAGWPRRGPAAFFVSAVALVLFVLVLGSDVGPAEAAFDASWSSRSAAQAVLDFEFYRENVEPIFLRGHGEGGLVPGACVMCHYMAGWDSLQAPATAT